MIDLPYEDILKHIRVLCGQFPHRHTGEKDEEGAVGYIERQFKSLGLETRVSGTPVMGWEVLGQPTLSVLEPEQREIECAPFIFSGSTPPDGMLGTLSHIGSTAVVGGACIWEKWALIDPKTTQTMAYVVGNVDGPALAQSGPPSGFSGTEDGPHYTWPACIIGASDHHWLMGLARQRSIITARYNAQTRYKPGVTSYTVEALLPGANVRQKEIIIGAHHDTQGAIGYPAAMDSPGGVDNASGVAVVLALAKYYKARSFPVSLRFCTFGGEEWNCILSRDYVRLLIERGRRDDVCAYVNFDQPANGAHINIFCSTSHCAVSPAIDMEEIARSTLQKQAIESKYKVRVIAPPTPGSDHWAFYKAGIPVFWACWHAPKDYHRAGDDLSNCMEPDRCLSIVNFVTEGLDRIAEKCLALYGDSA